jgi:hypothetical protein
VSLSAEAKDGRQPIHFACINGHLEVAKWLSGQAGVSLTAEDKTGRQPIRFACMNGQLEVAKWLSELAGVSLTAEGQNGLQLIRAACINGQLDVAKWLSEQAGVSLTAEGQNGRQPIHFACINGHLEVAKWLSEQAGVSLTAEGQNGRQPIHFACINGQLDVAKWLSEQEGVSMSAKDKKGGQPHLPYPTTQSHKWSLFTPRPAIITSFAVPSILGLTRRSPEEAVELVKYGETLPTEYYIEGRRGIMKFGEANYFSLVTNRMFAETYKDEYLSGILGRDVYIPNHCHTGIFSLEIVPGLGLGARLCGVTRGCREVVHVNSTYQFVNDRVHKEFESIILSHMATWRSQQGIVVLRKTGQVIKFSFDQQKWDQIMNKLQEWAGQHGIPNLSQVDTDLQIVMNLTKKPGGLDPGP